MSTEQHHGTDLVVRPPVDQWVDVVADVGRLSTAIAATEFVPKSYRGKSDAVMATILHGRELGLGPMTALAITDSIQGRPTLSAEGARALYYAAGHELVFIESTSARCEVKGRRAGTSEWTTVVWTLDDARGGGLLGKDVWKAHPRRMLQARASAELIRLVAPDVLHGMATPEEIDEDDTTPTPAATVSKVSRRTKPAPKLVQVDRDADPAPAAAPAPLEVDVEPVPVENQEPLDVEVVDEPAPAKPAPPANATKRASSSQLAMLGALWSELGVTDPDQRRANTAALVRRELADGSTKDLTVAEASDLIAALTACTEADDPLAALRELLPKGDS